MKPERTIIIGAGIGGMALAAALARVGLRSLVLERAPRLGEVGSGLGVLPSAVRALETLNVSPALFADAAPFRRFFVCSRHGEELAEVDFSRVFRHIGRNGYVMHRAALHASLCACVDPHTVRTGTHVISMEESRGSVLVHIAGESTPISGDLVIGADGLHSITRDYVLGDGPPRYAGETIFRGIAEVGLDSPEISREVLGAGQRAAYYDLGKGRCYWWATAPLPPGTTIPQTERRSYLEERFAGWPFGLPELFARTAPESVLQNDIFDRRPARTWHRGRVGLVGDAAHPTTPNLGQGACMAIEDAVVLARSIVAATDIETALTRFHAVRSRRTASIIRMSRVWGRMGLWRSAPLLSLRDALFRYIPDRWFERGATDQYGYDPGPLVRSGGDCEQ